MLTLHFNLALSTLLVDFIYNVYLKLTSFKSLLSFAFVILRTNHWLVLLNNTSFKKKNKLFSELIKFINLFLCFHRWRTWHFMLLHLFMEHQFKWKMVNSCLALFYFLQRSKALYSSIHTLAGAPLANTGVNL